METASLAAVLKLAVVRPDIALFVGLLALLTFLVEKGGVVGVILAVLLPIWLVRWIIRSIPKAIGWLNRSFQKRYGHMNNGETEQEDIPQEQVTILRGKEGEEPEEALIITKVKLKK